MCCLRQDQSCHLSGVLTSSRTSMLSCTAKSIYTCLDRRKGDMSYEDRCKLLKWSTLSDCRTYLSLVECYKIVFGFYQLKFEDFFDFAAIRSRRANHQYKLYVKPARLNCYKLSFFIRIVKLWNAVITKEQRRLITFSILYLSSNCSLIFNLILIKYFNFDFNVDLFLGEFSY